MRRIFITGVAGFIGSNLAASFLARRDQVVGIDNLNDYYNPLWKKENLKSLIKHPAFTFHKMDILQHQALTNVIADYKPTTIVHLAARAGVRPSLQNPMLYEEVNVGGTLHLLEIARKAHIAQMVYASSSSVYGNSSQIPFSEQDPCNEPISPYAATKKAGELFCSTFAHLYGIRMAILRFFSVYGPNGRPDMAPYLFTEALMQGKKIVQFGAGVSKRDYTYIDDIVQGILSATDNTNIHCEVINLGNSTPVSLLGFIRAVERVTGKKANILPQPSQSGDIEVTCADIRKAKKLLGFSPHTSLEVGLRNFVQWYKEHRM